MRARTPDRRRRSVGRTVVSIPVALGTATLLFVAAALVARGMELTNLLTLVLAASMPYTPLFALLALGTFVLCRRKLLAAAALTVLVLTLAVQVPWYYRADGGDVGAHTDIRVLSANLRHGQVDAQFFVDLADNADVITVSELTAEAVERLSAAGIDDAFPHSALIPRRASEGMGLWSRYPLTRLPESGYGNNFVPVRIQVPGVRHDPLVSSVHLMSPLAGGLDTFGEWQHRIVATRADMVDYAEQAGPAAVIVAGDFNATIDMRQFRDLLGAGYQDGVRQTAAGFSPTYSPHRLLPPLITIDHVLTRNAAVTAIHTVAVPGTDHRALLATVAVPLDPSAS